VSTKLLVIIPVSVDIWDSVTLEIARKVLSPNTEIVVRHIPDAPPYIETEYEKQLAAPLVVREVIKANKEGFHGIVINCFDDPGLEASREVSDIPVFGIGETSLMVATLLGYNIAIIVPSHGEFASIYNIIYRRRTSELGIEKRVVHISRVKIPILDLRKDVELVKTTLLDEIKRAVEEYHVDVVVLGCGGFAGLGGELSKFAGIPVIDPLPTTLKVAEALLELGLRHRKVKTPLTT